MTAEELQAKLNELAPLFNWEVETPTEPEDPWWDARCRAHIVVGTIRFDFRYSYSRAELTARGGLHTLAKVIAERASVHFASNMVAWRPTFPVLLTSQQRIVHPEWPRSVPWTLVAPHEAQAKFNYSGQDLRALAKRGGLSPYELLCLLRDEPLEIPSRGNPAGWQDLCAMDKIITLLAQHNAPVSDPPL